MSQSPPTSSAPSFRPMRIVMVVFPIAIVVAAVMFGWGYLNISGRIARFGRPDLLKIKGKVEFQGKPLAYARIETSVVGGKLTGAFATADDQGNFVLSTDLDEGRTHGAFAGEHKIVVTKTDHTAAVAMAVPNMTPAEYESFDTTPLKFVFDANLVSQGLNLKLVGEPRYQRPELADKPAAPRNRDFGMSLTQMAAMVRPRLDSDKDGKLNLEEFTAGSGQTEDMFRSLDEDQDGFLSDQEIGKWLSNPTGGGDSGGEPKRDAVKDPPASTSDTDTGPAQASEKQESSSPVEPTSDPSAKPPS
ncbi:MAG: hypothetical protein FJ295_19160 [Planctomycetes bacterium]|nr:hypothetical protein [Planctomycetota bacterium]